MSNSREAPSVFVPPGEFFLSNFIAAGLAGSATKTLISPLDQIYTHYATASIGNPEFNVNKVSFARVLNQERGYGVFFQGTYRRMLSYGFNQGLSFAIYDHLKFQLGAQSFPTTFVAGALAGAGTVSITSATEYLKEFRNKTPKNNSGLALEKQHYRAHIGSAVIFRGFYFSLYESFKRIASLNEHSCFFNLWLAAQASTYISYLIVAPFTRAETLRLLSKNPALFHSYKDAFLKSFLRSVSYHSTSPRSIPGALSLVFYDKFQVIIQNKNIK